MFFHTEGPLNHHYHLSPAFYTTGGLHDQTEFFGGNFFGYFPIFFQDAFWTWGEALAPAAARLTFPGFPPFQVLVAATGVKKAGKWPLGPVRDIDNAVDQLSFPNSPGHIEGHYGSAMAGQPTLASVGMDPAHDGDGNLAGLFSDILVFADAAAPNDGSLGILWEDAPWTPTQGEVLRLWAGQVTRQ